jgi:hypothetical protein
MFARRTLLFIGSLASFPLAAVHPQTDNAQQSAAFSLSGLVHDESNTPISSAELRLARKGEAARLSRSGPDGRFTFSGIQSGDVELSVRRMGYKAVTRNIQVNASSTSRPVDVLLQTVATEVGEVLVEGEDVKLHEFYERRSHNNFGKYFDGDEIMKRDPRLMSEILRTVPGASIGASTRIGNRVLLRGCKPTIWVNGMKAFGAEVDEVANPTDIAGMEVYLSWAGLPPQFQDRENPGCGAIILWTRDR